jgi:hypothetical protein
MYQRSALVSYAAWRSPFAPSAHSKRRGAAVPPFQAKPIRTRNAIHPCVSSSRELGAWIRSLESSWHLELVNVGVPDGVRAAAVRT